MGRLQLHFGALCPKLKEQLMDYMITGKAIAVFQKDADAITRLVVRGFITDSQATKARQELINKIAAKIK